MSNLTTSGTIRLSDVCAIYNAPAGTALSAFVRGGTFVNQFSNAPCSNIPTAAPIRLQQLYGTGPGNYIFGISTTNLVAAYTGESYRSGSWYDVSGNGRTATVSGGTITVTSNAANFGGRTFVSGTTATTVTFPTIMNSNYTLFHVMKYNGGTSRRILTTTSGNWLSGFWSGSTGVAYHEGWVTQTGDWATAVSGSAYGNNNWLLSADQNNLYRANGYAMGTAGPGTVRQLGINTSAWSGETSDWSMACLLVYNTMLADLTNTEQVLAANYRLPRNIDSVLSVGQFVAGATSTTRNLASSVENCSTYSVVSTPSGFGASVSGSTLTLSGDVSASSTGTVIVKATSANGAFTFLKYNVSRATSDVYISFVDVDVTTSEFGFYNAYDYVGYTSGLAAFANTVWGYCNDDLGQFFLVYITVTRRDTGAILREGYST